VLATAVIPVWGAYADWLPDAIETLRDGDTGLHIVVVDNASDPPISVPDGVELVRLEGRVSLGAARNAGLAAAATPWVLLWDADDTAVPGSLERLLDAARGAPQDVCAVVGGIVDASTGREEHWPRPHTFRLARGGRAPFLVLHAIWSAFPTVGAAVLRREALVAGGGFPDAETGDDWVAGVSLAARGRVVFDSRPARRYRRHPASVSVGWSRRRLVRHGRLARRRLAEDPAVPRRTAALSPLIAVAQWLVIFVVRPVALRLRRRRSRLS
jgi:glycosyltransferase involved in cell wall biosynthesis